MIIKRTQNQSNLPVDEVMYEFYEEVTMTDPITENIITFNQLVYRTSLSKLTEQEQEITNTLNQVEASHTAELDRYNNSINSYNASISRTLELKELIQNYK